MIRRESGTLDELGPPVSQADFRKPSMPSDFDYVFKVEVFGDPDPFRSKVMDVFAKCVREEEIMNAENASLRFEEVDAEQAALEETEFSVKLINLSLGFPRKRVQLQIWDIQEESLPELVASDLAGVQGVILFYDARSYASFIHAQLWLQDIQRKRRPSIPVLLVGNNAKETIKKEVSLEDANQFANKFSLPLLELNGETSTSARICSKIKVLVKKMIKAKEEKDGNPSASAVIGSFMAKVVNSMVPDEVSPRAEIGASNSHVVLEPAPPTPDSPKLADEEIRQHLDLVAQGYMRRSIDGRMIDTPDTETRMELPGTLSHEKAIQFLIESASSSPTLDPFLDSVSQKPKVFGKSKDEDEMMAILKKNAAKTTTGDYSKTTGTRPAAVSCSNHVTVDRSRLQQLHCSL
jgi:Ras-related protein Rab-6A